ncbi:glycosyltransferase family 4 protein [Saprospiraceae bacterium]|nr:glycosyltransferase family 4 protein [Saprospiraceae bacterium]
MTKKFPYPPKDGESVAILAMAKGYRLLGHNVDLLAMNTIKHHVEIDLISGIEPYYNNHWSCRVNTNVDIKDAFTNLFSSKSYNIERFISPSYKEELIKVLKNNSYEIIQLETLYLTPYIDTIKKYSQAAIVLRSHNIENEIWYNLSASESNIMRKLYYKLCYKRLKEYEMSSINQYDMILPITDRDKATYLKINPKLNIKTVEVGIQLTDYNIEQTCVSCERFGYIGSLDWRPNIEGLNWFFDNIWNKLYAEFPDLKFHLAGRNADQEFLDKLPHGVEYFGEVDDATAFISTLDAVIVPLLSGSGIRIKILESMAMAKTVISTPKGFEGIGIVDMENAIVFESYNDIQSKFKVWKSDSNLREKLSTNARAYIAEHFDIASINRSFIKELNTITHKK